MLLLSDFRLSDEVTYYTDNVYPITAALVHLQTTNLVKINPISFLLDSVVSGTIGEAYLSDTSLINDAHSLRTNRISDTIHLLTGHIDNHEPLTESPVIYCQPDGPSEDLAGLTHAAVWVSICDIPSLSIASPEASQASHTPVYDMPRADVAPELFTRHSLFTQGPGTSSQESPVPRLIEPAPWSRDNDRDHNSDSDELYILPASSPFAKRQTPGLMDSTPPDTTRSLRLPRMRRSSKAWEYSRRTASAHFDSRHSQESRKHNIVHDKSHWRSTDTSGLPQYYRASELSTGKSLTGSTWQIEKDRMRDRRLTGQGAPRLPTKRKRVNSEASHDQRAGRIPKCSSVPARELGTSAPSLSRPTTSRTSTHIADAPPLSDLFDATEALESELREKAVREAAEKRERLELEKKREKSELERKRRAEHTIPDDLFEATEMLERSARSSRPTQDVDSRIEIPRTPADIFEVTEALEREQQSACREIQQISASRKSEPDPFRRKRRRKMSKEHESCSKTVLCDEVQQRTERRLSASASQRQNPSASP